METTSRPVRATRTTELRVCPTCWASVHADELTEHDGWHDRVRREALAEARAALALG